MALDGNVSKHKLMKGATFLITTVPVVGVKLQAKNRSGTLVEWFIVLITAFASAYQLLAVSLAWSAESKDNWTFHLQHMRKAKLFDYVWAPNNQQHVLRIGSYLLPALTDLTNRSRRCDQRR